MVGCKTTMYRFLLLLLIVCTALVIVPDIQAQAVAGDELVKGQADIANGEIASSAGIVASKLANTVRDRKASFNLPDPVTGDDGDFQVEFPAACTLQEVACNVQAATSVTINIYERARATPETGTTGMLTSNLVCDTNGAVSTTFTDSALAADVPLALGVTAVSGTPALLRVHVKCRTD